MFPSETSQGGPSLPHSSRHCGLLNPHQNSHFSSAYSILAFLAHSPRLLFPLKIISKGLPQQQSYLAVPIFWICYFSHYWILGKKQLKEWGVCFGLRFGRLRWLWRGGRAGRLYNSHEADRWCWCSTCSLHFIKSWKTAHEMLLFIFRVSLSYLAKPFWK